MAATVSTLSSSSNTSHPVSCAVAAQYVVGFLGTLMTDRSTVPAAIRLALSVGYRRIDCAPVYFNEDAVGDALLEAMTNRVVTREDLFVVSKLVIEAHPYLQQAKLVEYCKACGVHFQAYSLLGTPDFKERDEPAVLAKRYGISVAAVCLAWAVQRGTSVVAKSSNPEHQRDNLEAATSAVIRLNEEEMDIMASLDYGYRFFRPED
jgi:diketogulonate reductase-like aldo/keto reductase